MKSLEQKIIVRCKNCGWRIFDKVTMTTGVYGIDKTYLLKKRQPIRALVETQYTSS